MLFSGTGTYDKGKTVVQENIKLIVWCRLVHAGCRSAAGIRTLMSSEKIKHVLFF